MSLRDSAIVAYAETKVMKKSDRDVWVLAGEILESLLDKTGFSKSEIDGLVMSGLTGTGGASMFWAQSTADMLGLEVGFCEQVHTGGCSSVGAVARAAAAIDAGMCEVALCLFSDTHVREHNGRNDRNYRRDWTDPYGMLGPPSAFGLLSRSYEAKYGLDYRVLGKLAVTQRNHAILNENACEELRVPITVEDYLNSRMIADPIRLLDCVMLADGAAGLILTSRKKAAEKGLKNCVIPIGYAELIAIVIQFDAFGLCKPGEGIAFVCDTDLAYNGTLPLNTGGGQISAGQAACSSHNLIEAVRQLMGEGGPRQVKDTTNALVTGIGWINYGRNWGTSAALCLVPNQ
ncbi:MAG: thiolase family protein [Alphaproteobacteria bacterium]|nr:thiolase family protein [Alphaproteobacteria bacterium]